MQERSCSDFVLPEFARFSRPAEGENCSCPHTPAFTPTHERRKHFGPIRMEDFCIVKDIAP